MLRIGIAGIGFMGLIHYLAYQKVRGAKVTALCSRSSRKLKGDWRGIQGNFGPAGTQMDVAGLATYRDFDDLLADPDIDLVDITLPPHLHADAAMRALRAGKHVFCEKPLTLDTASSRRLARAAQRYNRQLLVGHVLPFFPEYQWARKVIDSKKYGKPFGATFRRIISDPDWLKNYWDPSMTGGPMLDLHVHDAHFIRLVFGMPVSLTTRGRMRGECAELWSTQFKFSDPEVFVAASGGTIGQQGRPFLHGFEIHLERATLAFEFAVIGQEGAYLCEPTIFLPGKRVSRPNLGGGDPMHAFQKQLTEVTRSIRSGEVSPILSGQLAADAITLCHRQTRSLVSGKAVRVS